MRPLRPPFARHTFATLALEAGKNIRWVADQLCHAGRQVTTQVYAHALPKEGADLAFADFGSVTEVASPAPNGSPSRKTAR
jgi:integrase